MWRSGIPHRNLILPIESDRFIEDEHKITQV